MPYSASRAAGEPPAPGAKVFTENVRHLGSFIEKRPFPALGGRAQGTDYYTAAGTGQGQGQVVSLIRCFLEATAGHFHESGTYYWPDPDILSPRAPAAAAHAD